MLRTGKKTVHLDRDYLFIYFGIYIRSQTQIQRGHELLYQGRVNKGDPGDRNTSPYLCEPLSLVVYPSKLHKEHSNVWSSEGCRAFLITLNIHPKIPFLTSWGL